MEQPSTVKGGSITAHGVVTCCFDAAVSSQYRAQGQRERDVISCCGVIDLRLSYNELLLYVAATVPRRPTHMWICHTRTRLPLAAAAAAAAAAAERQDCSVVSSWGESTPFAPLLSCLFMLRCVQTRGKMIPVRTYETHEKKKTTLRRYVRTK